MTVRPHLTIYRAKVRYWKRSPYRRGPARSRIETVSVSAVNLQEALIYLRRACNDSYRRWQLIEMDTEDFTIITEHMR